MGNLRDLILEELTKADVKDIVKQEIKREISGNELKRKVVDIVKREIGDNPQLKTKVKEITKDVLAKLYKQMWVRKSMWQSGV